MRLPRNRILNQRGLFKPSHSRGKSKYKISSQQKRAKPQKDIYDLYVRLARGSGLKPVFELKIKKRKTARPGPERKKTQAFAFNQLGLNGLPGALRLFNQV